MDKNTGRFVSSKLKIALSTFMVLGIVFLVLFYIFWNKSAAPVAMINGGNAGADSFVN